MTILSQNPTTLNLLSPLNFKVLIKRAPNVNWFVQKISAPGMLLPTPFGPSPFSEIPEGGDKLQFETLDIQFLVDEDMSNYMEIFNWLYGLAGPDGFQVPSAPPTAFNLPHDERALWLKENYTGFGPRSEIVVSILNSAKQPFIHFVYHDCVPTSLSSFDLDTRDDDVNYVVVSASFAVRSVTVDQAI
jgi:hypothetical protein